MRIWWAALLVSTGCGRILGIGDFQLVDAGGGSGSDGKVIGPDGYPYCIGSGLAGSYCFQAPPTPVVLQAPIDTTMDTACTRIIQLSGLGSACAIAGSTVTVAADLIVTGARPLVLVGEEQVVVGAALDASSHHGGQTGAGAAALSATCMTGDGFNNQNIGGTGGAGGSFGTTGGDGGSNGQANPGGIASPAANPASLTHAGCPGGNGGNGAANSGGVGGQPGGTLYLLAGSSISIGASGAVFAAGAGGSGSNPGSGAGGGGGTGGLIGLEAPTIMVTGIVAANGGGGGGGSVAQSGHPGADGTTTTYSVAAAGGLAESAGKGANGGDGGALNRAPIAGSPAQNGGGGGGGGSVGIIWVHGSISGTQISPPATNE